MYTLIANLMLTGIFGVSCFLPKLILDLFFSSKVISRAACLIQSFCVTLFAYCEISTFTIMAYDTYLAVCHPLRYAAIMTNRTALRLIAGSLIFSLVIVALLLFLSARLPLCGSHINNFFCDYMSIFILSCVSNPLTKLYGTIVFTAYLTGTMMTIAYSYLRILLVCLKVSRNAAGLVFPPLLNPLIYGIRTKALRVRVISHLQKTIVKILIG
uniref:G-protein coupled receptors family 1 profile domain-containing protein n=1 Tax=Xenopus tropicalis TaxID=8364 RepID=A0A803JMA0_XENTR